MKSIETSYQGCFSFALSTLIFNRVCPNFLLVLLVASSLLSAFPMEKSEEGKTPSLHPIAVTEQKRRESEVSEEDDENVERGVSFSAHEEKFSQEQNQEIEESARAALQQPAGAAAAVFRELLDNPSRQEELRSRILEVLKNYEDRRQAWIAQATTERLGEMETLEEATKPITFEIVEDLDVSTKENEAVFWTGYPFENQTTGMDYAEQNEKKTIEMTRHGKLLDQLGMYKEGSPIAAPEVNAQGEIKYKSKLGDLLFDAVSKKFAKAAHGKVTAVVYKPRNSKEQSDYDRSAYARIEEPILLERERNGENVKLDNGRVEVSLDIMLPTLNKKKEGYQLIEEFARCMSSGKLSTKIIKKIKSILEHPEQNEAFQISESLQKELESWKAKEADLIKREAVLAQEKEALKQANNQEPIQSIAASIQSAQKEEELAQQITNLEVEKKKAAEEREALIEKIKLLLGVNAKNSEEPIILDETYEAIGRRLLGKLALDDPFENVDPEDKKVVGELASRTNLEARTLAYEKFFLSLYEYKRAKNKLQRWEKRWKELHPTSVMTEIFPREEKENDAEGSVVSAESSMSQLSSIPPAETFLIELQDSSEQARQIRELRTVIKKLRLERKKSKEDWCNIIKEQENRARAAQGKGSSSLLDLKQPLPREIEEPCTRIDEAIRSRIADQRKIEESRKECAENQLRWAARVKLEKAKEAELQTAGKPAADLEQAINETKEAEEHYFKLIEENITEATEQNRENEIRLLDESVSRLWRNFYQPEKESKEKKEQPLFTLEKVLEAEEFFKRVNEKFFQYVENARRLDLEEGRIREYIKALQEEKIKEACDAFLQGKEKQVHTALMSQSAALAALAREGMNDAIIPLQQDWKEDKPRRLAQRYITISNAYQYAVILFEKEVERLDQIKKYWEYQLTKAATAYAMKKKNLWKALTHEERGAYNLLAATKNEDSRKAHEEALQKLEKNVAEAQERAKGTFFFSSSKQQALDEFNNLSTALKNLKSNQQEKQEQIRWAKLSDQERKMEGLINWFQLKVTEAEKNGQKEIVEALKKIADCCRKAAKEEKKGNQKAAELYLQEGRAREAQVAALKRSDQPTAELQEKIAKALSDCAYYYSEAAEEEKEGNQKAAELYLQAGRAREVQVAALKRSDHPTAELQEKIAGALGREASYYSQAAEEEKKGNQKLAELYIQAAKAREAQAEALKQEDQTAAELQAKIAEAIGDGGRWWVYGAAYCYKEAATSKGQSTVRYYKMEAQKGEAEVAKLRKELAALAQARK